MIVTNKEIQEGTFDQAILKQIKIICEEWKIRYSLSSQHIQDNTPFILGFKLKDKEVYE